MAVVLVCGPPCAGKSTYVEECASADDLVVDQDAIAQGLGSLNTHTHKRQFTEAAEAEMMSILDMVAAGYYDGTNVWVVRCLPKANDRAEWAEWLRVSRVVLLNPDTDTLLVRARQRKHQWLTERAIHGWKSRYTP